MKTPDVERSVTLIHNIIDWTNACQMWLFLTRLLIYYHTAFPEAQWPSICYQLALLHPFHESILKNDSAMIMFFVQDGTCQGFQM
jgi:hypothetical protein